MLEFGRSIPSVLDYNELLPFAKEALIIHRGWMLLGKLNPWRPCLPFLVLEWECFLYALSHSRFLLRDKRLSEWDSFLFGLGQA